MLYGIETQISLQHFPWGRCCFEIILAMKSLEFLHTPKARNALLVLSQGKDFRLVLHSCMPVILYTPDPRSALLAPSQENCKSTKQGQVQQDRFHVCSLRRQFWPARVGLRSHRIVRNAWRKYRVWTKSFQSIRRPPGDSCQCRIICGVCVCICINVR